jgi:ribosomal-protein-alanine N-acetyltransferase
MSHRLMSRLAAGEHVLRPFRSDLVLASDSSARDRTRSWPPITSELIADVVEKIIAEYATLKSLRWALARKDDDALIGSCGFTRWAPEHRSAELAYDLAPAYWGFGVMTAAARAAVAWAFDTAVITRVEAFVMTTNERSIAVRERTGFRKETTVVGYRVARGVSRDFHRYSVEQSRV